MALLGKIRKNMWLVIILVALGLGGFILQDMMSGQQSLFGSQQTYIGKVEGQKLDQRQFNFTEELMRGFLYRNSNVDGYALRNQLWNYFVEENIVKNAADQLGLGVPKNELRDLQFGTNLSPVITQRFQNPDTRQIEREQLSLIQKQIDDNSLDPSFKEFWRHQENEVIKQRLQEKYAAMAAKSVYTPSWMVEMLHNDQNTSVDFNFVRLPFDDVDNTEVALTDADFEKYYADKKSTFRQEEETRVLEYLIFNVTPTSEDSAAIVKQVSELKQPFLETENDSFFVDVNEGGIDPAYLTKEDVSVVLADTIFSIPVGEVYGPYQDGNTYRLVKVLDNHMVADSADTRHILIGASTPADFPKAEARIDSILNVLQSGITSFDSLAINLSQDQGSASKGGKYEGITPNTFVPEFNEVLFVTGELGRYYKIRTSFGYHLVEVLKRYGDLKPRVKLAYVARAIEPSDNTQKDVQTKVYNFLKENRSIEDLRSTASADPSLTLETSSPLKRNDFQIGNLGTGNASRNLIRWAFGDDTNLGRPEVGDVSPEYYSYQDEVLLFDNKYVVAALKSIIPKGIPKWQDIREQLEPGVINMKKGELIIANKIKSQDLSAIAAANNVQVDTARSVTFLTPNVPGMGAEPKVIAKAFAMEPNGISEPINGQGGVYVIKLTNKTPASAIPSVDLLKRSFATSVQSAVNARLVQTLKKGAEITDNRARFF